jgi:hypothetical protein
MGVEGHLQAHLLQQLALKLDGGVVLGNFLAALKEKPIGDLPNMVRVTEKSRT